MEEQPLVHQHLLRLIDEAGALDTEIKAAVVKMEAAKDDKDDRAMYTKIYDNLVAREKDLSGRRAVLEAQLAGKSKSACRCVLESARPCSHQPPLHSVQCFF